MAFHKKLFEGKVSMKFRIFIQTKMMNLHMKLFSEKYNNWILYSLIFAQCHKKEHSYVINEAGSQCDSMIQGRISSQIESRGNFLKSLNQLIKFQM